jgi:hypothetical protein
LLAELVIILTGAGQNIGSASALLAALARYYDRSE